MYLYMLQLPALPAETGSPPSAHASIPGPSTELADRGACPLFPGLNTQVGTNEVLHSPLSSPAAALFVQPGMCCSLRLYALIS